MNEIKDNQKELIEFRDNQNQGKLGDFIALKGFFLKVVDGPLVSVEPGAKVKLFKDTALQLLFQQMVYPANLPKKSEFEALKIFKFVNSEGIHESIAQGEIVILKGKEALDLMLNRIVKPVNETDFNPWAED
ncbi:MAG: hypothetical protein A2W22_06945 [Candidatus Levybacteria bacterium RBG_16_35_11]|nr:MAG: hypothetical protein A2W22_06945 [Candidatus Levybacteria bacterium RBG_16_35_11]